MEHLFELAPSSRSKCRGCGETIDRGEPRFGEQVENPFSDKLTHLWFHPRCAAYKRPEPFLEALVAFDAGTGRATEDQEGLHPLGSAQAVASLRNAAQRGIAHRRLARIDSLQSAPSGRASCRHCRERIVKGALRIALVWFEGGKFDASGYLHVSCAPAYCEANDILPRLRQFSSNLGEDLLQQAAALLAGEQGHGT